MTAVPCPSCGHLTTGTTCLDIAPPFAASQACYATYLDLTAYNATRARWDFLHQEAVDAYAAQHPGPPAKNITLWFALVGLHLAVDRGRTGREVQQAHQRLAARRRTWSALPRPEDLTGPTAGWVMSHSSPDERDAALMVWAADVWASWQHVHADVQALTADAGL